MVRFSLSIRKLQFTTQLAMCLNYTVLAMCTASFFFVLSCTVMF